MRTRRGLLGSAAIAFILCACPVLAQTKSGQGKSAQRPSSPTRFSALPGAALLAREHNISMEEATRRVQMMGKIAAVVEQLQGGSDPDFAGVWVQHQPSFKLVVAYTNPSDAKLAALTIDPEVRGIIELRTLPVARRALLATQDRVIALLGRTVPYVSYIEEEKGRLVVRVETEAQAQQVRTLLAALTGVSVELGPVPDHVAAPRYVEPGDWIDGGHWYYGTDQVPEFANEEDYRGCTFAFPARWGTTQGILTAGHCNPGSPAGNTGTGYWHFINGHYVELPAPTIARWAYGTKYDYQFHETTGYDSPLPFVYYENKSLEPGFGDPNSWGTLTVAGSVGYYGQTQGMPVCKSGWRTGATCASIRNGAYVYNGVRGWIELYRASGLPLAKPGDSGGAVFSPPDYSGTITAYGIATAADTYSDGSSVFVYMPIDYIDDEVPIKLVLSGS